MTNVIKSAALILLGLFFFNQVDAQKYEPARTAGELVKNGGFIGSMDGWTSDGAHYKETGGNSTQGHKTGGYVVLNHNGSDRHDPSITQKIDLGMGRGLAGTYIFEVDVKKGAHCNMHQDPKTHAEVDVFAIKGNGKILKKFKAPTSTDTWQRIAISWTIGDGDIQTGTKRLPNGEPLIFKYVEITLVAEIDGTDCDIDFDNASMIKEKPVLTAAGFEIMPVTLASTMTLEGHKAYAAAYPYADGGWRLPTVDELRKILPALGDKANAFQGIMTSDVWQTSQYMVNHENGEIKPFGANNQGAFYTNKLFVRK